MVGGKRRMAGILGTALCALVLGLSACGGSSGGGTSTANNGGSGSNNKGCVAEVKEINGVNTRAFCGNASAQASVSGQTWNWKQGECETVGGQLAINIGRVILGTGAAADQLRQQYDYFGVVVSASADGTYTGIVTGNHQGTKFSLTQAKITISESMKKGTFSGTSFGDNAPVSGSWSC